MSVATDVADPAERLRTIHDGVLASRAVRSVLGHDLLEQRADVVPPQLYQPTVRLWSRSHAADHLHPPLNVILSNVAGPRAEIRMGPVGLDALYSVGPILEGIGLNITAWSYQGVLGVSLIGCPRSLPDPWALADQLHLAPSTTWRRAVVGTAFPPTGDGRCTDGPGGRLGPNGTPSGRRGRPEPGRRIEHLTYAS